jgi:hypothetical protein
MNPQSQLAALQSGEIIDIVAGTVFLSRENRWRSPAGASCSREPVVPGKRIV